MKNKIIVVAPHADDEIIGCGGTIAKAVSQGDEVYIIIATNANVGAPELFNEEAIAKVRGEAIKAHEYLGVTKTFFLDFPAPALNAFPEYKVSVALSKIFNEVQPNILYLPHPGDLHQDHKAVYRASLVAARPQGNYTTAAHRENTIHEIRPAPDHRESTTTAHDYFGQKICLALHKKLFGTDLVLFHDWGYIRGILGV